VPAHLHASSNPYAALMASAGYSVTTALFGTGASSTSKKHSKDLPIKLYIITNHRYS